MNSRPLKKVIPFWIKTIQRFLICLKGWETATLKATWAREGQNQEENQEENQMPALQRLRRARNQAGKAWAQARKRIQRLKTCQARRRSKRRKNSVSPRKTRLPLKNQNQRRKDQAQKNLQREGPKAVRKKAQKSVASHSKVKNHQRRRPNHQRKLKKERVWERPTAWQRPSSQGNASVINPRARKRDYHQEHQILWRQEARTNQNRSRKRWREIDLMRWWFYDHFSIGFGVFMGLCQINE